MISKKEPLKGLRIVITREAESGKEWVAHLRKRGATVHRFPTIRTSLATPDAKTIEALKHLSDFGWIVFTSPKGPLALSALMRKEGIEMPAKKVPIAAIGKKTAQAVRAIGLKVAFMPSAANGETLARELSPLRSPLMLVRADIASDELPEMLAARAARVTDIAAYETTILREPAAARFSKLLVEGKIDCLTFASASAVRGFSARVKGPALKAAQGIPSVAIGSRTAEALAGAGFRDVRTARDASIEAVADAILARERYTTTHGHSPVS